jgi:hypothetical protein
VRYLHATNGHLVYSVRKRPDIGTSLDVGPFNGLSRSPSQTGSGNRSSPPGRTHVRCPGANLSDGAWPFLLWPNPDQARVDDSTAKAATSDQWSLNSGAQVATLNVEPVGLHVLDVATEDMPAGTRGDMNGQ